MKVCTYREIARMAHVAVSTVSKALSNASDVSEQTIVAVRNAALSCGYFQEKRRKRRELSEGHRFTISLLVPEINSSDYAYTAEMLCSEVKSVNVSLQLHIIGFEPEEQQLVLEQLETDIGIDGIICCGLFPLTRSYALPVVQISPVEKEAFADRVFTDYQSGIATALLHLQNQRCNGIAFAGEKKLFINKRSSNSRRAKTLGCLSAKKGVKKPVTHWRNRFCSKKNDPTVSLPPMTKSHWD